MKEKAEARELPVMRTREELWGQVGKIALCGVLGLVSAHTRVYGGLAPFGVGAAAAASGTGAVFVYLLTSLGYLLQGEVVVAMRYIAAIAAIAGTRFTFGSIRGVGEHRLFAPVAAFVSTALTGLLIGSLGTLNAQLALSVAGESLLAGGFAYFFAFGTQALFRSREERHITVQQQAALVITVAVALMSVSSWEIQGISPGRIVTVLLILLCARTGKEQMGTVAGVVFGTAIALVSSDRLYLAVAYAFAGLLAGMFTRFGKLMTVGSFVLGSLLISLTAENGVSTLIAAYEALAGGILFLVVPTRVDEWLHTLFFKGEEGTAEDGLRHSVSLRLDVASRAMADVAGTVDAVSRKLAGVSSPDLGTLYFGVSDTVCRRCGLRMLCWEKELTETMDAFNHLTPLLREHGMVEETALGGSVGRRCRRLTEVTDEVNRGYAEHRLREGAWRRLGEIRSVVTDQFSGMAELLAEFSDDFSDAERLDTDAAMRVRQVCEEYKMKVEQVVCTVRRSHRMYVDILASDTAVKLRQKEWMEEIGNACGRIFDTPRVTHFGDTVKISFAEKPRYRTRIGCAQLCCEEERLCGDAYETFSDGAGYDWLVLSDGMGSGGRAAVDGAMAAGLTARLFEAGFGEDSVLRMVNSALMVKSGDESLATLDVLSVDCFTGKMKSLKAGAAASLLCSKGRVSRLDNASLPVGILRDIAFQKQTDTLVDGDVLLMMSDGVLSDGIAWVEQLLAAYDSSQQSLRSLAETVALGARERQKGHQDDITVLALRLEKAI